MEWIVLVVGIQFAERGGPGDCLRDGFGYRTIYGCLIWCKVTVNHIHLVELGYFSPLGVRLHAPLYRSSPGSHGSQKPYRNRNRIGDPGEPYGTVRVTMQTRNRIPYFAAPYM